jgi:hypothetical protein
MGREKRIKKSVMKEGTGNVHLVTKTPHVEDKNRCINASCRLRKAGCSGFEGCPGFQSD